MIEASSIPAPLKAAMERQFISAQDVLAMRREVFKDNIVSTHEADMLFAANDQCPNSDPKWTEFFIEAMTDHLVHQAQPEGYLSEENATWLIERISHDGYIHSETELELLVKILETAQSSPSKLVTFALEQVKHAAMTGEGPTRKGLELKPGVIGEAEVDLIRRIIYAFGGDQHIGVTRAEAEILFDLNDATVEVENHPSWSDLFVKAIANFLMASFGYKPLSREEAMSRDAWLNEKSDGVFGLMGKMVAGGLSGVFDALSQESEAKRRLDAAIPQIASAEMITNDEAHWLANRIGRDGTLHENERALLRFLEEEAQDLPASLKELIAQAA